MLRYSIHAEAPGAEFLLRVLFGVWVVSVLRVRVVSVPLGVLL